MKQSGIFLEEEMINFCKRNNFDEGQAWKILNNIHTKEYGRNIMFEKNQHERENNLDDIPMSQYFAETQKVSNAITILKGMQNCIANGWEFE